MTLKKLIKEKKIIYDYNVDQRAYKWSGKNLLEKINDDELPGYLNENKIKFKNWLD